MQLRIKVNANSVAVNDPAVDLSTRHVMRERCRLAADALLKAAQVEAAMKSELRQLVSSVLASLPTAAVSVSGCAIGSHGSRRRSK